MRLALLRNSCKTERGAKEFLSRLAVRAAPFALLGFLAMAAALGQNEAGRIDGMVVDSVSHQPVKKAFVTIFAIGVVQDQAKREGPQTATTDSSGGFAFTNLPAGEYQLTVTHQNYPQARMGGVRKAVHVTAVENAPRVVVALVPGAAITGHVVDEDGDALTGCIVQLHSAKDYRQTDGSGLMRTPMAHEDGSYRLYRLAPGKYTITAQCPTNVFEARPLSEGPDPAPSSAYPIQFYPGANDLKSAQVVELLPGVEKSGIDFQMRPLPVTHIHGKLAGGSGDWRGRDDLEIQLEPLDLHGPRSFSTGAQINPKDGSFELPNVFPGSYRLIAFSRDLLPARGPQGDAVNGVGGILRVDVADKPVEVSLQLHRAMDIAGTVEMERGNNTTNQETPGEMNLQLTSETQFGGWPPTAQVNDDGSFSLKSVLPGEWRIQLIAPSAFVKSIRLGNDDVTGQPMDLTSGSAAPLHIVVSTNTATLRGTAPPGQIVYVSRMGDDSGFQGTRGVPADTNGQFSLGGLAPGTYRVELGEIGSPPMGDGGQEVTLAEGENASIEVKPETKP